MARGEFRGTERLYRRALSIFEGSYGPNHPVVAAGLNNLAQLLQATNRLSEAEPLLRRGLAILHQFREETGHAHPNWRGRIQNYKNILKSLALPADEIARRIGEVSGGS